MYRKSINDKIDCSINKSIHASVPIAESTHIEELSKQRSSRFPWGGRISTPKRKASSILQNSKSIIKLAHEPVLSKRIDPQVYMDVHSPGLVSRIVKYHENKNIKSNYNKPGEFPIVHLKKESISNNIKRDAPHISFGGRISGPDDGISNLNQRALILRGCVGGEINSQNGEKLQINEPLAPTTEIEPIPTKSVLDALKEISRKRINNEILEVDGNFKKSCTDNDQTENLSVIKKRQRDSGPLPGYSGNLASDIHLNKKSCIKPNNEIASSLSSSNLYNIREPQNKILMPTTILPVNFKPDPRSNNQTKVQYDSRSKEKLNLVNTNLKPNEQFTQIEKDKKAQQQKLTLFNKKPETIEYYKIPNTSNDNIEFDFIKPKLSDSDDITSGEMDDQRKSKLSAVQKSRLAMMLACLRDDDDDEDEVDSKDNTESIPTKEETKPESKITLETSKNDVIVSKPIISVSTSANEVPVIKFGFNPSTSTSVTTPSSTLEKPLISTSTVTSTTSGFTIPTPKVTTSLPDLPKPSISVPTTSTAGFSLSTTTIQTNTTSIETKPSVSVSSLPTSSPPRLGGFKFGNTSTTSSSNTPTIQSPANTLVSQSKTTTTSSVLFTNPVISTASNLVFNPASIQSNAKTISTGTITPATTSIPSFSFSNSKTPSSTSGTINFGVVAPNVNVTKSQAPSFTFGQSNVKTTATTAAAIVTPVTTQALVFGASTNTNSATKDLISFGNVSTIASSTKTSNTPSFNLGVSGAKSDGGTGMFSFHNPISTANPVSTSVNNSSVPAPIFGFGTQSNSTVTTSNTSNTFTFGQSSNNQITSMTTTTNTTPSTMSSIFGGGKTIPTFGSSTANPNTTTTIQSGIFGQNTAVTTSANTFGLFTAKSTAAPIVTTTASTSSNLFSFGGGVGTNTQTSTSSAQTSTMFGSSTNASSNVPNLFNFKSVTQPQQNTNTGFQFKTTSENPPAPTFGSPSTTSSSIFGGVADKSTPNVTVFGGTQNTISSPAFSFTGGNNPSSSSVNQGNIAPFSFGSSTTPQTTSPSQNMFGAVNNNQTSNSTFTFGSNNTKPPAFGNANTTPQFGNQNPGQLSFGGIAKINDNPATNTNNSTNAFSFTAGNSSSPFGGVGTSSNVGNAFGQTPASTDSNKTFSFSGNQNQTPSPAFNFNNPMQPQQAGPVFGSPAPAGSPSNPFSIGPGGNSNSHMAGRKFIRATSRRLK